MKTQPLTTSYITYDIGVFFGDGNYSIPQKPSSEFIDDIEEKIQRAGVKEFVMMSYHSEHQEVYWRLYDCSEGQLNLLFLQTTGARVVMRFK